MALLAEPDTPGRLTSPCASALGSGPFGVTFGLLAALMLTCLPASATAFASTPEWWLNGWGRTAAARSVTGWEMGRVSPLLEALSFASHPSTVRSPHETDSSITGGRPHTRPHGAALPALGNAGASLATTPCSHVASDLRKAGEHLGLGSTHWTVHDDGPQLPAVGVLPILQSTRTMDADEDGFIDGLHLTFSEAMSDATMSVDDWNVSLVTVLGWHTGLAPNDAEMEITFTDGVLSTDATPQLTYLPNTASGPDLEDVEGDPFFDDALWWDAEWLQRARITMNNSASTEDLEGFPLLVRLTAAGVDFSAMEPDGSDLRFVDDDGTLLPHEVESWDVLAETATVWVRVQRVDYESATDFIHLYYENPGAPDVEDAGAVWDPAHSAVFHLEEATIDEASTGVHDNSAGVIDGSQEGNAGVPGVIAGGQDFDGLDDRIRLAGGQDVTTTATVSAWVRHDSLPAAEQRYVDLEDHVVLRHDGSTAVGQLHFYVSTDDTHHHLRLNGALSVGNWMHVAGTWDGATMSLHVNGRLMQTSSPGGTLDTPTQAQLSAAAETLDGALDEVRISTQARSGEWIEACYLSQRAESGFTTFGGRFGSLDGAPPTATLSHDGPSVTAASSVAFHVTFSEEIAGLDLSDFSLVPASLTVSGPVTLDDGGDADPRTHVVTVDGIAGSGTLDLSFAGDTDLTDLAGLPLNPASVLGAQYTIDTEAPTLVNNTGASVAVGGEHALTQSELHHQDMASAAGVIYEVTVPPTRGQLELVGAPGVPTSLFTQADVDAARVVYAHLETDTVADGFDFEVSDDLGNTGGATSFLVTLAQPAVSISPGIESSAAPGGSAPLSHRVTNVGTVPIRCVVRTTSSCRHDIEIWTDTDDDGQADLYLGTDALGDGVLGQDGDVVSPAGDSDGDGRIDTGLLLAGESLDLIVIQLDADPACSPSQVNVVVEEEANPDIFDEASNLVHVGNVTLSPNQVRSAVAGDVVWLPHTLRNNTGVDELIDLDSLSSFDWPYSYHLDSGGNGDPADAGGPLSDSDGSDLQDILVPAGASRHLFLQVSVPPTAARGLISTVFARALIGSDVVVAAVDTVTVADPFTVGPNYLVDMGTQLHEGAGRSVYFAHRLTNAAGQAESFNLAALSDLGWEGTFLSDPDGDGRPHDAIEIGTVSPPVPGNGGYWDFFLRVDIPDGVAAASTSRVTLTVQSATGGPDVDHAYDDVVVSIVRAYEDASHLTNLRTTLPCSTVHAMASGLPGLATGHTFLWRDASGAMVRSVPATIDVNGEGADSLALGNGELGEGWTVDIQRWDGATTVTLDSAEFDVEDPVAVTSLVTEQPWYDIAGMTFEAAIDLENTSFLLRPEDVTLGWLVLSPDRTQYLTDEGAFTSFTGSERTRAEGIPLLERQTTQQRLFSVGPVTFPEVGDYRLEAWLSHPCEAPRLVAATAFTVLADVDGDGLDHDEEVAAGTDPLDADSDDDGLLDGADGVGDSDGDGAIDALDCDSDDDGLVDGLEAGVVTRDADTAPDGCFQADQWPLTTTDPDNPDTDGGGVPDGVEDANGDGRIDVASVPPEGDPNDPSDDVDLCSFDPPPELADLRVTKDGTNALIAWSELTDPCTTYTVLSSEALPVLATMADQLTTPSFTDAAPQPAAGIRYYVVAASSVTGGDGPTGH